MSISKDIKRHVFEAATTNFETEEVRNYFLDMSEYVPDYFFTMPASTSGKYHSAQQCEMCGELVHAYMIQEAWDMLLGLESIQEDFAYDAHKRDLIRCFALLHDCMKCGDGKTKYTVPEHPRLAATLIQSKHPEHDISDADKVFLTGLITTHSGQWNTDRAGNVIMPKPRTIEEKFGHYLDMFCSRKNFLFELSEAEKAAIEEVKKAMGSSDSYTAKEESADPGETVMPFGKYKGMKFSDIPKVQGGWSYLEWVARNMNDKPNLQAAANYVIQRG